MKQKVKQSVSQSVVIHLEKRKRKAKARAKPKTQPKAYHEPATVQYFPFHVRPPPNPMSMFTQEQVAQKLDSLKAEILEKVKVPVKVPVAKVPVDKYLKEHGDEKYVTSLEENPSQVSVLRTSIVHPSQEELSMASLLGVGIPRERTISDLTESSFQPSFLFEPRDNISQFKAEQQPEPHPALLEQVFSTPKLPSFQPESKAKVEPQRVFEPVPKVNPFEALPLSLKSKIASYVPEPEVQEPEVKLEDVYRKRGRPLGSVNRPKGIIEAEKKLKEQRRLFKKPLGTPL